MFVLSQALYQISLEELREVCLGRLQPGHLVSFAVDAGRTPGSESESLTLTSLSIITHFCSAACPPSVHFLLGPAVRALLFLAAFGHLSCRLCSWQGTADLSDSSSCPPSALVSAASLLPRSPLQLCQVFQFPPPETEGFPTPPPPSPVKNKMTTGQDFRSFNDQNLTQNQDQMLILKCPRSAWFLATPVVIDLPVVHTAQCQHRPLEMPAPESRLQCLHYTYKKLSVLREIQCFITKRKGFYYFLGYYLNTYIYSCNFKLHCLVLKLAICAIDQSFIVKKKKLLDEFCLG